MSTTTQPASTPAHRGRCGLRLPSVQTTTITAVTVVAAVAAVISYSHMQQLAANAGNGWRISHLLPLSVDGQLVAASMVMLVRRRAGHRPGWLAYIALTAGIAVSLTANIASPLTTGEALPRWVPALLAAWPPLALLLAYELLMSLVQQHSEPEQPAQETATVPTPIEILDAIADPRSAIAEPTPAPAQNAATEGKPASASQPAGGDIQEIARRKYREIREAGSDITGLELGTRYGRSDSWGRARIREVKEQDRQVNQLHLVDEQEIRA